MGFARRLQFWLGDLWNDCEQRFEHREQLIENSGYSLESLQQLAYSCLWRLQASLKGFQLEGGAPT